MFARFALLALLVVAAAGCGFHLRGYGFATSVSSYALTAARNIQVTAPLRDALRQAGVEETGADQADVHIQLLDQRRERRNVSTTSDALAAEYEMIYAVNYALSNAQQQELIAPTWIERTRIYRIDRGNIVGSSEEQALVERELLQDVVGQIIRTLDAVQRAGDAA